jgi:hypothetical protein
MSTNLKSRIEEYESALTKLDDIGNEEAEKIYKETTELIKYMHSLSSDMEQRRTAVYDDAVKRITIIVPLLTAVVTIVANQSKYLRYLIPVLGFGCIVFIFSIIIMIQYWVQSQSKYIFKDKNIAKFGNSWKWFYYGNPHIVKIHTNHVSQRREAAETLNGVYNHEGVDAYMQGLLFMIHGYLGECSNSSARLQSNIQQLYLMQVHNYYKNRQHMCLAKTSEIGIFFSIGIVALCIVYALWIF